MSGETRIVPLSPQVEGSPALARRAALRGMSADQWIESHASGTLRKNKRLGMSWQPQYREERTAFEFGWTFECLPRSRVTYGDAITEQDNHAITEAGWHIDRYITMSVFPEDRFETKYLQVEHERGGRRTEGIGIVVRETSAAWLPAGHVVFAIVAQFKPRKGRWKPARNPA